MLYSTLKVFIMYSHLKFSDFFKNQFCLFKRLHFCSRVDMFIRPLTQTVQDKENGYMTYVNTIACKVNV